MQLTERHIIDRCDPRYPIIDQTAFASKNLYNAALYVIRQSYIFESKYLCYNEIQRQMQSHEAYKALPTKVSQQVLMQLAHDWDCFFKARDAYNENPAKFTGRPKLPKYKHKIEGRNLLVYTLQSLSGGRAKKGKGVLQKGIIKPSKLPIEVRTQQEDIVQVRIVPRKGFYVVEVIYERDVEQVPVNPAYYAGIDIGMNNLAALTSNKPGFVPVIVNGRPVKSINQFYNKRKAELQKQLGYIGTTKRIERLTNKRNRRIDQYIHEASRWIIDHLVREGIGTLCIGKNDGWKQAADMSKRTNQNFVSIPHARFIHMLTYKASLVGITVKLTEEAYTSKASFLDLDPLPMRSPDDKMKYTFSGKRIKRGLYRAANGQEINADCNGSYNIIRKVAPKAFAAKGVEDDKGMLASLVVHPVRIVVPVQNQKESVL